MNELGLKALHGYINKPLPNSTGCRLCEYAKGFYCKLLKIYLEPSPLSNGIRFRSTYNVQAIAKKRLKEILFTEE